MKKCPNLRILLGAVAALGLGAAAMDAQAGTVYFGTGTSAGYAVSATADVTFGPGSMTVVLTNTTPFTADAAQLLTGFVFDVAGVASVGGLLSATTPHARTVDGTGVYADGAAADLLSLGTWELTHPGSYQLDFNPDAEYALLGAPTAGSYAGANGSIKGNPGHNPFSAETATFTIALTGVGPGATLTNVRFLYNTGLSEVVRAGDATTPTVPTPSAAVAGLTLLGLLAAARRRVRVAHGL